MEKVSSRLAELERAKAALSRTVGELKKQQSGAESKAKKGKPSSDKGSAAGVPADCVVVPRKILLDLQTKFTLVKKEVTDLNNELQRKDQLLALMKSTVKREVSAIRQQVLLEGAKCSPPQFRTAMVDYLKEIKTEVLKLNEENKQLRADLDNAGKSVASGCGDAKCAEVLTEIRANLSNLRSNLLVRESEFNRQKAVIRKKMTKVRCEILEGEREKTKMEAQIKSLISENNEFKNGRRLPPKMRDLLKDKMKTLREELLRIETENMQLRMNAERNPLMDVATELRVATVTMRCCDATVQIIDGRALPALVGHSIKAKAKSFAKNYEQLRRFLVYEPRNQGAAPDFLAAIVFADGFGTGADVSAIILDKRGFKGPLLSGAPCIARYALDFGLIASATSSGSAKRNITVNTRTGIARVQLVVAENGFSSSTCDVAIDMSTVEKSCESLKKIVSFKGREIDFEVSDASCPGFSLVAAKTSDRSILEANAADLRSLSRQLSDDNDVLFVNELGEAVVSLFSVTRDQAEAVTTALSESRFMAVLKTGYLSSGTAYKLLSKTGTSSRIAVTRKESTLQVELQTRVFYGGKSQLLLETGDTAGYLL